jgi:hypothetical protein
MAVSVRAHHTTMDPSQVYREALFAAEGSLDCNVVSNAVYLLVGRWPVSR